VSEYKTLILEKEKKKKRLNREVNLRCKESIVEKKERKKIGELLLDGLEESCRKKCE